MPATERQEKLASIDEAIERWQRKLFRAATELKKLTAQRKRLVGPRKDKPVRYRSLDDIRMAAGGSENYDELPG